MVLIHPDRYKTCDKVVTNSQVSSDFRGLVTFRLSYIIDLIIHYKKLIDNDMGKKK